MKREQPTSAQALRAFEAMYPGLAALSAEGSGTAWVVRGYGRTDPTMDSTIAVQSTVSPDATGVASALVDGVRWSGSADLGALLESRSDSDGDAWSVVDAVWMSLPDEGTRVVDVQRVPEGRIRVSVATSEGAQAPLFVFWDTDTEQWQVSGTSQESEPETPLPAYLDSLPAHRVGRRPTNSEITAVVKKFAARQNSDVALARVGSIKVARDSRGRWWVSSRAVPVKSMYDEATLYLYKQGARWRLKAFGTNVDSSALPKDVRSRL